MSLSNNFPTIRPSLLLDFANTKQLDPRITFSRASTATYYDGKTTAMAEQNLFTYSQDFDNAAWTKVAATVTANSAAAPDGTTTADSVIEDSSTGAHQVTMVSSAQASVPYTVSCYLKAGARSFAALQVNATAAASWVSIDLSTGTVGTITALSGGGLPSASASSVSVGNGWYRIILTFTPAAGNTQVQAYFGPALDATTRSYAGNGTGSVLVWGAQLEQRSSVTAYTATTSAPITNYIPVLLTAASGVARFDNNPTTGESLGLLIEEQRTNLLTYSEQFDNAAWTKSNASVTANTVVAPDGTLSGDKLVEDSANSTHYTQATGVSATATPYTFSFYAKAAERTAVGFYVANGNVGQGFVLTGAGTLSGTIGASAVTSASITPVGNGWYRCTATWTPSAGNAAPRIYPLISTTGAGYQGDGYSGLYIWGAQLEAGAFATSYIATTSAQVTRAADAASMTGTNFSSWYRQDEGTIFVNAVTATTTNRGLFFASNSANTVDRIFSYGTGTSLVLAGNAAGVNQFALSQVPGSLSNASALAYKVNNFAATSNGAAVVTSASGFVPTGINQIQFGWLTNSGDQNINGAIKKIAYYPARVTNTQLQALTS